MFRRPPVTQNGGAFNVIFPLSEILKGSGLDVTLYHALSTPESTWGFAVYIPRQTRPLKQGTENQLERHGNKKLASCLSATLTSRQTFCLA